MSFVIADSYEIETVSTIRAIGQEEWDRLAPDDPMWSWSFYRALEDGDVGPDGYRYLVYRDDSTIAAVTPAFWFDALPMDSTLGDGWQRRAALIRKLWPGFLKVPVLFCGHPMGEGHVLARDGYGKPLAAALAKAARALAKEVGASYVIFKDFRDGGSDVALDLPDRLPPPYFTVPSFPDARLQLNCTSFDDYLAGLKSKARRNARSKLRKFDATPGLRLENVVNPNGELHEMMRLYAEVLKRAEIQLDHVTESFLTNLSEDPNVESRTILCHFEDQLVGFLTCVFSDKSCVALRAGLDYGLVREHNVWFVLHYEFVRAAIERGCGELNFCQTTYPAKLELGCDLVSMSHVMTHRNPLLRWPLRRILPLLQAEYRQSSGLAGKAGGSRWSRRPVEATGSRINAPTALLNSGRLPANASSR